MPQGYAVIWVVLLRLRLKEELRKMGRSRRAAAGEAESAGDAPARGERLRKATTARDNEQRTTCPRSPAGEAGGGTSRLDSSCCCGCWPAASNCHLRGHVQKWNIRRPASQPEESEQQEDARQASQAGMVIPRARQVKPAQASQPPHRTAILGKTPGFR